MITEQIFHLLHPFSWSSTGTTLVLWFCSLITKYLRKPGRSEAGNGHLKQCFQRMLTVDQNGLLLKLSWSSLTPFLRRGTFHTCSNIPILPEAFLTFASKNSIGPSYVAHGPYKWTSCTLHTMMAHLEYYITQVRHCANMYKKAEFRILKILTTTGSRNLYKP